MKRPLPIVIVTLAFFLPTGTPASAATQQIMPCRTTSTGWEIWRGNLDVPKTTCRFANATFRKLRAKQHVAPLPWRFGIRVGRKRLRCAIHMEYGSARIVCRSRWAYVSLRHS